GPKPGTISRKNVSQAGRSFPGPVPLRAGEQHQLGKLCFLPPGQNPAFLDQTAKFHDPDTFVMAERFRVVRPFYKFKPLLAAECRDAFSLGCITRGSSGRKPALVLISIFITKFLIPG